MVEATLITGIAAGFGNARQCRPVAGVCLRGSAKAAGHFLAKETSK
jgi:hypothetical protein